MIVLKPNSNISHTCNFKLLMEELEISKLKVMHFVDDWLFDCFR